MSENKNLKYAIMGGAALVGAAVLYYLTSSASKENSSGTSGDDHANNEELEAELDQIGEIEYEDGHIKFEQFLKIFEICSFYGKTHFAE